MKLISIACNHCGAPLDVPLKTRYLTCSFCESSLEVQQSGNAYFTSVLEAVGQIKEDVGTIKLQNELERIDREWEFERGALLISDNHGRASVPSNTHLVMSIVVALFGVAWTVLAYNMSPPMAFFGIVLVILALVGGFSAKKKAGEYRRRRGNWEGRRRKLLAEIRGR